MAYQKLIKPSTNTYECIIMRRLNRFTVEVLINGERGYAHITNTGRLMEYMVEGKLGYCMPIEGSKLRHRLFAVSDHGGAALIDTVLQEKSFIYMVENNMVEWLRDCMVVKHNVRIGSSIIDYMIKCGMKEALVELKSAVLRVDDIYASYPDCPTQRARFQINSLIKHVQDGGLSYIVFIAGLPGVVGFKPYDEGDKVVAELIREAYRRGVVVKAINIYYEPELNYIVLKNPDLPVYL